MTVRPALPERGAFAVAAAVLVVSLWTSAAPSMVYPLYAEQWDVSELVTTALFAVYPTALVLALVACGSLSDSIGRRRVLLAGVGIVAAGTVLFMSPGGLVAVFVGRALQGAGVGVAMSAASAALLDFAPRQNATLASSVNTAATAGGTAIALLVGGALVQYVPSPTHVPFVVLLAAAVALLPLLWMLPEPTQPKAKRWRPSPVSLPAMHRRLFATGVASIAIAFMVGGVFVALGAQIVRDLVGTRNAFHVALTLAIWALAIIPASVIARRSPPRIATVVGGGLSAVGALLLIVAAETDSFSVFLLTAIPSGAGYGLMFYGGLGMVTATTRADTRAANLSFMFLVAYLGQGLSAVGIGWLASVRGLSDAVMIAMPTLAALSIASAVAALALKTRRA